MNDAHHIQEELEEERKISSVIHIVLFCLVLTAFGLLFFLLPQEKISDAEKRTLAPFPTLTKESLLSGDYMDSLDLYTADHFPYRSTFISVSDQLKLIRGFHSKEESFYNDVQAVDELPAKAGTSSKDILGSEEALKNCKGLLVANNRAFQIFSNEEPMNKDFSEMNNLYAKKIKGVRIFSGVVPTASDFLLPTKYEEYIGNELENISASYAMFNKRIEPIEIHQELAKHKKEYIYYKTDHHWTNLGAYYGYKAFCKAAKIKPIDLSEMKSKQIKGDFLGTHFLKTKDQRLESNPDYIKYWIPPVEKYAVKYDGDESEEIKVFKTSDIAKNKYLVFLGGDEPLIHLKSTKCTNGKTILLIKNSYGNPFAAFLTANYENVLVVDYRYTETSIEDLVKEYAVNDIVILNGIYSSNTPNHIDRLRDIIELKDGVKNTFKKKKRKKKEEDSTIPSDSLQLDVDTTSVID